MGFPTAHYGFEQLLVPSSSICPVPFVESRARAELSGPRTAVSLRQLDGGEPDSGSDEEPEASGVNAVGGWTLLS